jgi:hypothetical protein
VVSATHQSPLTNHFSPFFVLGVDGYLPTNHQSPITLSPLTFPGVPGVPGVVTVPGVPLTFSPTRIVIPFA